MYKFASKKPSCALSRFPHKNLLKGPAIYWTEKYPKFFLDPSLVKLIGEDMKTMYNIKKPEDIIWLLPAPNRIESIKRCWLFNNGRIMVIEYYPDRSEYYNLVIIMALDHKNKPHFWNYGHECMHIRIEKCHIGNRLVLPVFCTSCDIPFMKPRAYKGRKACCMSCRMSRILELYFPNDIAHLTINFVMDA